MGIFIISLVVLVAGYFVYGRFVEKKFGIDETRTCRVRKLILTEFP